MVTSLTLDQMILRSNRSAGADGLYYAERDEYVQGNKRFVTVGFVVERGVVVRNPPYIRWANGMPIEAVLARLNQYSYYVSYVCL